MSEKRHERKQTQQHRCGAGNGWVGPLPLRLEVYVLAHSLADRVRFSSDSRYQSVTEAVDESWSAKLHRRRAQRQVWPDLLV